MDESCDRVRELLSAADDDEEAVQLDLEVLASSASADSSRDTQPPARFAASTVASDEADASGEREPSSSACCVGSTSEPASPPAVAMSAPVDAAPDHVDPDVPDSSASADTSRAMAPAARSAAPTDVSSVSATASASAAMSAAKLADSSFARSMALLDVSVSVVVKVPLVNDEASLLAPPICAE